MLSWRAMVGSCLKLVKLTISTQRRLTSWRRGHPLCGGLFKLHGTWAIRGKSSNPPNTILRCPVTFCWLLSLCAWPGDGRELRGFLPSCGGLFFVPEKLVLRLEMTCCFLMTWMEVHPLHSLPSENPRRGFQMQGINLQNLIYLICYLWYVWLSETYDLTICYGPIRHRPFATDFGCFWLPVGSLRNLLLASGPLILVRFDLAVQRG